MMPVQTPAGAEPSLLKRIGWEVMSWMKTFAVAIIVVFLLTTFVFQIIGVEGSSMIHTLEDGDRMLVTKYQYLFDDPARFDVVICHYPGRKNVSFVKRIVGVPGDRVAMVDGTLYVNGEAVDEPYIENHANYNMPEVLVEDGHYFVLGDNRSNSNDSHMPGVGQLDRGQIMGQVRAILWPLSDLRWVW